MTDTQTLEGAVALLRRVRGPFAFTTRELMDDINVFLALPSVSPDLPADAPGEGRPSSSENFHLAEWNGQYTLRNNWRPLVTFKNSENPAQAKSDAEFVLAALNALTSAPAPRFDPDVARSKGQSDYEQGFEHGLRARLAAEEAQ